MALTARQRHLARRPRRGRARPRRPPCDHPPDGRHRDGARCAAHGAGARWPGRSSLRPDGASASRKLARGDRAARRDRGSSGRPAVDRLAEMAKRPLRAASPRAEQARHLSRRDSAGRDATLWRRRALRVGSPCPRELEACRFGRAVRASSPWRRPTTPAHDSTLRGGLVTRVVSACEGTWHGAARRGRPRRRFHHRRCRRRVQGVPRRRPTASRSNGA